MTTIIPGIISILLVMAFLGVLVVKVLAPPLVIIIVIVLGLMIYDFIKTVREERNQRN